MKKNLLKRSLFFVMMLAGAVSLYADEVMIGSLTDPMPQSSFPLWTYYECSESEMYYTADDLKALAKGNITGMTLAYIGGQNLYTHIKIWLENVKQSGPAEDFASTDNMPLVFDKDTTLHAAKEDASKSDPDFMIFEFSKPFEYTGGGILVHIQSISTYYCMSDFKFVGDRSKIVEHTITGNNGLIRAGYTAAMSNYKNSTVQFPVVIFTCDDSTTGVDAISAVKCNTLYSITGQKVDASAKGFVITSDGKKYFRK